MKNVPYQFAVLRYVHDTVTQEFVNVGVALFAPEAGFLGCRCTDTYVRISQMFAKVDGSHLRQIVRYIQTQVESLAKQIFGTLPFEQSLSLDSLLARVLPVDDSAFQFSHVGVGLTSDPARTHAELYQRHIETYIPVRRQRRDDEEVWRAFKEPLDRFNVTRYLTPKRIVTKDFEYQFERSWKNEIWHVYEPVSLDYVEASSMLDRAHQWVGRGTDLIESQERFRLYLLLGEPRDERLKSAFQKAQNILNKIPGQKEFVLESERDSFANELAREVLEHNDGC